MKIKAMIPAILTSAAMLLTSAFSAYAVEGLMNPDEELTDGTFTYELNDGKYTIVSCDSTAIVESIPELRNGYPVTAIGDRALAGCTSISKLAIPDTITSIGSSAFAGCTSLTEVTLPSRLETLSNGLFMGCTNLRSVEIPDSVVMICSYAFYNCSSLTDVTLSRDLDSIQPMAFAECSLLENIDASKSDNYSFEEGMLLGNGNKSIYCASTALTGDVYIPEGVQTIEAGAFSVCAGIEHLFIPSSVTYIGDDAFGYCTGLKSVDLSEGLVTIADIAFKECYSLESLQLPTTVSDIGEGAFYNCINLNRLIIPEGVKNIGMGAFASCSALKNVSIPKSVAVIGDNAFGFTLNSDGTYSAAEDFDMSVYSGTAGEKYAKANKFEHTTVDKSLKGLVFAIVGIGLLAVIAVFAAVLMMRAKKGAPASAKKADKLAREKEEEENYQKIIED
ncbi:MAG: leucine-rich repeat domain-containing protein [Alistipes sp.]|nr:leucine-rich repeat domain-containing protein [Alistipes sp.]